jgi:molybdopterin-binding protein
MRRFLALCASALFLRWLWRGLFTAWSTPITWSSSLVTVAQFNEQIRDNLNALKDPPTDVLLVDSATDFTTSSTSFVNVSNGTITMEVTIETAGGAVMIGHVGTYSIASANDMHLNVRVDGTTDYAGNDGICQQRLATTETTVGFTILWEGLPAGEHTFTLRWKVDGSTATLRAGQTTGFANHSVFWAREA